MQVSYQSKRGLYVVLTVSSASKSGAQLDINLAWCKSTSISGALHYKAKDK